jgi:ribosomal protein S18 acetylase RimI-like enzyme
MTPVLMRKSLASRPATPSWPAGVRFGLFGESEALSVHGLFVRAYQGGQHGSMPAFEDWWRGLLTDEEFDPALCLAAYATDGVVLAAAQGWTGGFIKDLAVDAPVRRKGLGLALLNQCFTTFWARSAPLVMLKVQRDNLPARALYAKAGMVETPNFAG